MAWKQTGHHLWRHGYEDYRAEIIWGITHTHTHTHTHTQQISEDISFIRPDFNKLLLSWSVLSVIITKAEYFKHDFLHPTPSGDCRALVWGTDCTNPWLRVTSRGQSSGTATGARSQRLMTSQASTCHLWIQYCLATTLVEGRDTWPNTGSIIPNKLNYSAV